MVRWWDDEAERDLADAETALRQARYREPVSARAGMRLREYVARMERIVARLRARREAAAR